MKFSLIVPTFGRPEEVTEFLDSLLEQNHRSFEVIISDGTPKDTLRPELQRFVGNDVYPLTIHYEEFLPVSAARNDGAKIASGEYFIFLDSDCIIPSEYLNHIEAYLQENDADIFGGPDAAHDDFTILQKAISYSMTSMLTTGGIRGKKSHVGTYHPRGFNMGMKREAFEAVNGYSTFRCGEDIELSIRLIKAGYKTALIESAHVFHKRRTSVKQFFKQVFRFGAARVNIWKLHPEELKLTHLFPLVFSLALIFSALVLPFPIIRYLAVPMLVYLLLVFLDSTLQNRSFLVGLKSIQTTVVMHFGYGWGFLKNYMHWTKHGKGMKL
ncbi:glycosyltransferase [Phaeocystidibacter luteus]|uniref:Glycosyltransferase n=1 Tax=Phaeocystidibacter luteus TaxID=911197 RepID=A0A6N6RMD6_9FLAO|nr:glycosyltransferase [Phaeocystidibacter luteus]KAB2814729.1 glycosyltransferase [Phaeocystidibacter luteus]